MIIHLIIKNEKVWVSEKDGSPMQRAIFRHCTNGRDVIDASENTGELSQILFMHGVRGINTHDLDSSDGEDEDEQH